MTEGQRVKLEELIEDYETAVVTLAIEPYPKWADTHELKTKALNAITDHLSTIQRFSEAQTMLIKLYADELNSDSEDLLYHFHRSLEKQDLLDSTTQTQIEPVKRNGA
jgi:hypothetical protein